LRDAKWFDAWVSVAELELKQEGIKAVSATEIINELLSKLERHQDLMERTQVLPSLSSMSEPSTEIEPWEGIEK
jgi:hypothetical protein